MDNILTKLTDRKRLFRIIILIWLILWINFTIRDLYKKNYFTEYKTLAKSNAEEKRAHTFGEEFYAFLKFAKDTLPSDNHYEFVGIDDFSLESRRGIYYLYPNLKKEDSDYLLVFDVPNYKKNGFTLFAKLDEHRFILKRK